MVLTLLAVVSNRVFKGLRVKFIRGPSRTGTGSNVRPLMQG